MKGQKPITTAGIQKAAKAQGVDKANFLTASQMRKVIEDLMLPGVPEVVLSIATAFNSCFSGRITEGALYETLKRITGEAAAQQPTEKKGKGKK